MLLVLRKARVDLGRHWNLRFYHRRRRRLTWNSV
jgi:hypothetical protein